MRILLTGSTGFVGKHLVESLRDTKHEIIHLVRTPKGLHNEVLWDFRGPLPDCVKTCNIIIHLAAYVDFSDNASCEQYRVNTGSALWLAEYARANNAYLIVASTIGVYGKNIRIIDSETEINPDTHYAMSKYLAEEIVRSRVNCFNILRVNCFNILRICGIYGLDGPKHLGLNDAITEAISNRKIPHLTGSGSAKRNYICVVDVAAWIMNLIQQYEMNTDISRSLNKKTLLLSGPEILSIKEYLQTLVEIVLPGNQLQITEGKDSLDSVIYASPAQFKLTTYEAYLRSLLN